MKRPDVEKIATRIQGTPNYLMGRADRDCEYLLDWIAHLESQLEGYRQRETGTMARAIKAQGGGRDA